MDRHVVLTVGGVLHNPMAKSWHPSTKLVQVPTSQVVNAQIPKSKIYHLGSDDISSQIFVNMPSTVAPPLGPVVFKLHSAGRHQNIYYAENLPIEPVPTETESDESVDPVIATVTVALRNIRVDQIVEVKLRPQTIMVVIKRT